MHSVYSFLIALFNRLLPVIGTFSPKLKEFKRLRRTVFDELKEKLEPKISYIWFHAASLGEYEQGVPVMEAVKKEFPHHKLLLTFFSPSGYNSKKNNPLAAITVYLPLDTHKNTRDFINLVKPKMAFFIKYEFWPNYLFQLEKAGIETYLISGVFRGSQPFFKFYGKWMVNALHTFDHFFVQDPKSKSLAHELGFDNVTLSGDTRYDRVNKQLSLDNGVPLIAKFKNEKPLLICGSTWPEDEDLLLEFINNHAQQKVKIVIAPHEINTEKIEALRNKITQKTQLFTDAVSETIAEASVLILNTIGFLGRAYSYADVAYVGGAVGDTGLHNILEPATFSLPIITGTKLDKFPEAQQLRNLAGLFTVSTSRQLTELLLKCFDHQDFRKKTGMISGHFIQQNTGGTAVIMRYLKIHSDQQANFNTITHLPPG